MMRYCIIWGIPVVPNPETRLRLLLKGWKL